jgi:hypothetical protein
LNDDEENLERVGKYTLINLNQAASIQSAMMRMMLNYLKGTLRLFNNDSLRKL